MRFEVTTTWLVEVEGGDAWDGTIEAGLMALADEILSEMREGVPGPEVGAGRTFRPVESEAEEPPHPGHEWYGFSLWPHERADSALFDLCRELPRVEMQMTATRWERLLRALDRIGLTAREVEIGEASTAGRRVSSVGDESGLGSHPVERPVGSQPTAPPPPPAPSDLSETWGIPSTARPVMVPGEPSEPDDMPYSPLPEDDHEPPDDRGVILAAPVESVETPAPEEPR
jgi:hypothetical protein